MLIEFNKELNKGKDLDSKIQIGVPQKFWIFWIYTMFFGVFLDFSKKKTNVFFWIFEVFGFGKS